MPRAIPVPIDLWINPQGKLAVETNEKEFNVYFNCWDINSNKVSYFGKVSFGEVIASRNVYFSPLDVTTDPHELNSYILQIEDSPWKLEVMEKVLPKSKVYEKREASQFFHYGMESKGFSIEIIAKHYTVKKINYSDAADLKAIIQIIS